MKRRCRRSSQRTSSSRRSTRPAPKSPARTGGSEVLVSNVRKQYPGADPVVPEALDNPVLTLEGQEFPITGPVQGDDGPGNSVVYIPSLKAVVTGDVVFDHVYFGVPRDKAREEWSKTISIRLRRCSPPSSCRASGNQLLHKSYLCFWNPNLKTNCNHNTINT